MAALERVKQNIAAFGGDPSSSTPFGQSAGAGSAGILMTVPAARGLLQKVILESGTPKEVSDKAQAIEVSRTFMKIAGVDAIEGLRRLSLSQMRDAQRKLFDTSFGYSAQRTVWNGMPFDGVTPNAAGAWQLVWVNSAP